MPEGTRIITTSYLTKIEVALNIPSGHEDISPEIRLEGILQAIQRLSQRANFENTEFRYILNEMQDYLEIIDKADFSVEFPDDPDEYKKGWEELRRIYAGRPGKPNRSVRKNA